MVGSRLFQVCTWCVLLTACFLLLSATVGAAPPSQTKVELKLATFQIDVTPAIGNGPCVGCMPKVDSIEHSLELRGTILRSDEETWIVAAIDFCGICNRSDDELRDALAKAASTTRDRVALQSLHQHSAPILDIDAVAILHGEQSAEYRQHIAFTQQIADRATTAIKKSLSQLTLVTRVAATRVRVESMASNRRVPQPDGSIAVRASMVRELQLREAPEGLIDPWLRTVTFFSGAKPLAQWHYYATHPQTFYGDSRISYDCVGMARSRWEEESQVFQVYFTGCGGNVALGKYNDGTREARERFADTLHRAMRNSSREKADVTVELDGPTSKPIEWETAPIGFTPRDDGVFHPAVLKMQLEENQPFTTRLTAAMFLGFRQRLLAGNIAQASRLRIGAIDILHLPGEPFVEFQLFAHKQQTSNSFVCVAGYGECGVWYYGPDQIYHDHGGYEQTWSVTGPCEKKVQTAIERLLKRSLR